MNIKDKGSQVDILMSNNEWFSLIKALKHTVSVLKRELYEAEEIKKESESLSETFITRRIEELENDITMIESFIELENDI